MGSCNQNNGRKKRQIQNCQGSQCNQNNAGGFAGVGTGFGGFPVAGATQNCQGSLCNQNNAGGFAGFGFAGATQNCSGSSCNQNNGRKWKSTKQEKYIGFEK